MHRRDLHADARLALGHDREEEADRVDAEFEDACAELLRHDRVVDHDGHDGVGAGLDLEAGGLDGLAEVGGVGFELVTQRGGAFQQVQHGQRRAGDARRQRVAEQIGPRALAQQLDHLLARRREAAGGAAQGLAEGAGDDVDLAEHAAVLGRAAAGGAEEAAGMAFVDAEQRVVAVAQRADLVELGDGAVHREHAVGEHQREARALGLRFLEAALQVGQVVVLIAPALGLAQPDAIDDGGVVQCVADDGVLLAEQGLEQAAVGVEGRGIEDGVLAADEAGDALLQRLVQVLGAADEAHRRQAEAMSAQRLVRRLDDLRMAGQAQVVVGTEVDDLAAVGRLHHRALRRGDDALGLEEASGADAVEFGLQVLVESLAHGATPGCAADAQFA
mmetsp:Transcript_78788/g.219008  ORF Transcript_78788/g.219008 Transcript_78788/m.219008 type:complete len:389 (-) Transcript_78788:393-1559(-)